MPRNSKRKKVLKRKTKKLRSGGGPKKVYTKPSQYYQENPLATTAPRSFGNLFRSRKKLDTILNKQRPDITPSIRRTIKHRQEEIDKRRSSVVGILGLDSSLAKDTESAKAIQIMANLPDEIARRIMTVDLPWSEQMKRHFGNLPEDSVNPRDPTNAYNQIVRLCKEYVYLLWKTIWRTHFFPGVMLSDCILEAKHTILRQLHLVLHKPNCPPEIYHELANYITKRIDVLYVPDKPTDPLYSQSLHKMLADSGTKDLTGAITTFEHLKERSINNIFNLIRFYTYLSAPKPTDPRISIPIVNLYDETHIIKSVTMDRLLNMNLFLDYEMYEEIARDGITTFWFFAEFISGAHNMEEEYDINYDMFVEASTPNVLSVKKRIPTDMLYDRDIPVDVAEHRRILFELADDTWRTNLLSTRLIDENRKPIMDENNQPFMDEEGNPIYPLSIALFNERLDFFAIQDAAAENENI